MSDSLLMKIEIPSDDDGYVLLQCSYCKEHFKLKPSDIEDDCVLVLHCPNCGLISDDFLTEDVVNLASARAQNLMSDQIYQEMKKWERQYSSKNFSFKVGNKPKEEYENPIFSYIDALVVHFYKCCNRSAKITQTLKFIGSYCPFCGVKDYETE